MREWLSGGAPPCQGGGRGFDSRLALFCVPYFYIVAYILSFYKFESYSECLLCYKFPFLKLHRMKMLIAFSRYIRYNLRNII